MRKYLCLSIAILLLGIMNSIAVEASETTMNRRVLRTHEAASAAIQTKPLQTDVPLEPLDNVVIDEPFLLMDTPPPHAVFEDRIPQAGDAILIDDAMWYCASDSVLKGFSITPNRDEITPVAEFNVTEAFLNHINIESSEKIRVILEASWESYLLLSSRNNEDISNIFDNNFVTGGVHIVDVSNPEQPEYVSHIPFDRAGGLTAIQGVLYARVTPFSGFSSSENFYAAFDIQSPEAPIERWRVPIPGNHFVFASDISSLNSDILYTVGRDLLIYDQSTQPPELLGRWEINQQQSNILFLKEFFGSLVLASKDPISFQSPTQQEQIIYQHFIRMSDPATPQVMQPGP